MPFLNQTLVQRFHWLHVNCHALDNAQLILALIRSSTGRQDFIRRVLARDLNAFLSAQNHHDLDLIGQKEYMDIEPDGKILAEVLHFLPDKLKRV